MFVDHDNPNAVNRGYNPAFVRKVLAKREAERREKLGAEKSAHKEQEKAARQKLAEDRAATAQLSAVIAQYRELEVTRGKKPVRLIILETAIKHGVSEAEIKGPRRTKHLVAARQEAMWRARHERPDLSLPQIGKAFGGRDHTTILHAVRKIDAAKLVRAALQEEGE